MFQYAEAVQHNVAVARLLGMCASGAVAPAQSCADRSGHGQRQGGGLGALGPHACDADVARHVVLIVAQRIKQHGAAD